MQEREEPTMLRCWRHDNGVVFHRPSDPCPYCKLESEGFRLQGVKPAAEPEEAIMAGLNEVARVMGRGAGSPDEAEFEMRKEDMRRAGVPWPVACLKIGAWIFGGGR